LLVWNAREIEDSDDFYIYRQYSIILALFSWLTHFGTLTPIAAGGIFLTWRQWRRLWLLYAMILALAGSVAAFYVFGRYRFPLVPLLVLFAGAAVVEAARLLTQRNWPPLAKALLVVICTAAIVNWPIRGVAGPGATGFNNLANAYAQQGKVEEAIRIALKAVEVQPDYGIAHYNLGNLYAQQGKFDLARRHFEEALRLYPNYADAHTNYGQLIAERGDLAAGIDHFRKAIALNPTISRAHLNLGVALAKQGRTDEAIAPLREAARLNPQGPEANYYLGSVYAAQNRFVEAAESFNNALRIQSDFAPAHQSLAQLLAMQGKKEEALQHYQEAVRLMKRPAPVAGQ
jgi:tetratricopeptide (TPR) repeat protein